jgi:capsular polysaccharide biosynthesis protein
MQPEHPSDSAGSPTSAPPSPSEGMSEPAPDGHQQPVPAKRSPKARSRMARTSKRKRAQSSRTSANRSKSTASPAGDSRKGTPTTPAEAERAADSEGTTTQTERRRLPLEPRVWTRFGVYALAIVLGASLAGYLFGTLGDTVRGARSEVLFELQADQPSGNLRQDRQLTTQLVTVGSRAVLGPVARENGLTFDGLSDKLVANVAEDSEVVRIEVHDRSASRAKTLVDAITREYIARARPNQSAEARRYLEGQLTELDRRQQSLSQQLADLRSTAPTAPELTPMTAEMQSLFAQRSDLQSRLEDVTVEEIREPRVEEITRAYVLPDPVSPPPWRAAAVGALTGLVVAAIVIAVLARRRMSTPHGA